MKKSNSRATNTLNSLHEITIITASTSLMGAEMGKRFNASFDQFYADLEKAYIPLILSTQTYNEDNKTYKNLNNER